MSNNPQDDLAHYDAALSRRAAENATLGDAVAIARGRPGPPGIPIGFDSPDFGACLKCKGPLIMLRDPKAVAARQTHPQLVAACLNCDVVKS